MHLHSFHDTELTLCRWFQASMIEVVEGLTILGHTGTISNERLITYVKNVNYASIHAVSEIQSWNVVGGLGTRLTKFVTNIRRKLKTWNEGICNKGLLTRSVGKRRVYLAIFYICEEDCLSLSLSVCLCLSVLIRGAAGVEKMVGSK